VGNAATRKAFCICRACQQRVLAHTPDILSLTSTRSRGPERPKSLPEPSVYRQGTHSLKCRNIARLSLDVTLPKCESVAIGFQSFPLTDRDVQQRQNNSPVASSLANRLTARTLGSPGRGMDGMFAKPAIASTSSTTTPTVTPPCE
jgi:hypothetical protein